MGRKGLKTKVEGQGQGHKGSGNVISSSSPSNIKGTSCSPAFEVVPEKIPILCLQSLNLSCKPSLFLNSSLGGALVAAIVFTIITLTLGYHCTGCPVSSAPLFTTLYVTSTGDAGWQVKLLLKCSSFYSQLLFNVQCS